MKQRTAWVVAAILACLALIYLARLRTPAPALVATVPVMKVPTPSPTPHPKKVYKAVFVPKKFKQQVAMDSGFALGFANFLCGVSYTNYEATLKALNNMVSKPLQKKFAESLFRPEELKDIQDRELVMSFKVTEPIKVIEVSNVMDRFYVEGILITKSDKPGVRVAPQPVAMIVGFAHGDGTDGAITVFEQTDPTDKTITMVQDMNRKTKTE